MAPQQPQTASIMKTSPALAHGADSSSCLTATNPLQSSSNSTSTASIPPDRPSVTTSTTSTNLSGTVFSERHCGVGATKAQPSRSVRSEGGRCGSALSEPACPRKASSLQDVNVATNIPVDVSSLKSAEGGCGRLLSSVSAGSFSDNEPDVSFQRSADSFVDHDACRMFATSSPVSSDFSATSQPRSRRRTRATNLRRATTSLELERAGLRGIVSNWAQFWEEVAQNSNSDQNSVSFTSPIDHGHVVSGVARQRRSRRARENTSLRYQTIGAPCDAHTMISLHSPSLPLHDDKSMRSSCSRMTECFDLKVGCPSFFFYHSMVSLSRMIFALFVWPLTNCLALWIYFSSNSICYAFCTPDNFCLKRRKKADLVSG